MLVTVPNPGAGNDLSYTLAGASGPALLQAVTFRIVMSIAIAVRYVSLVVDDGTDAGVMQRVATPGTLAALTDRLVSFSVSAAASAIGSSLLTAPLPAGGLLVPRGGRVRTDTVSLLAADSFTECTMWFEPVPGWTHG